MIIVECIECIKCVFVCFKLDTLEKKYDSSIKHQLKKYTTPIKNKTDVIWGQFIDFD